MPDLNFESSATGGVTYFQGLVLVGLVVYFLVGISESRNAELTESGRRVLIQPQPPKYDSVVQTGRYNCLLGNNGQTTEENFKNCRTRLRNKAGRDGAKSIVIVEKNDGVRNHAKMSAVGYAPQRTMKSKSDAE